MNVSLTAIALLWNAADQLAKLSSHGGGGGGAVQAPRDSGGPADALSAAHLEALLRQLFSALQVICPAYSAPNVILSPKYKQCPANLHLAPVQAYLMQR